MSNRETAADIKERLESMFEERGADFYFSARSLNKKLGIPTNKIAKAINPLVQEGLVIVDKDRKGKGYLYKTNIGSVCL